MKGKKITTMIATLLIAVVMTTMAEPADPSQRKKIKLDNGTERVVQLMGDEYGYYWKALDNGVCYREKPGQVNRFAEVSELMVKREAASQRRAASRIISKDSRSELGFPCSKMDLTGRKHVLALLVDFQDKCFSTENIAKYENIFNAINYTSGSNSGSVKDYFLSQSNNKLELQFDVVGPIRVSKNSAYYGAPTETQNDAHATEMVSEAVALADNTVDFSQYDWDGDGTVEMITIIFAGLSQSSGGVAEDIWAHKGVVQTRYDNVNIQQYACASELRIFNNVEAVNSIGTICHELSHTFGLLDTYDTSTGNYGTSKWDIMGTGVHNNNGYTPAGYTAYDKMYCLWQSPMVLNENQTISKMKPMSEGGDFYLIPNDAWQNEFFLLENRQQTGWDSQLPGHGMLIMHVDYDEELFYYNIVNRTGEINSHTNDHERLGLVLADNDMTIDNSNYTAWIKCLQGDLYPTSTNNSLTNTSTPNAKLYHKNIDNTYLLSKPVTNIKENSDGTMSFQFDNDLASQSIRHLTPRNGRFRYISDTEAKLIVDIKNDGYLDFSQKVAAYVYIKENDKYIIQQPRFIQTINLPSGETDTFEFPLTVLEDNIEYHVFLFYYKEPGATSWTQMDGYYTLNMADRNKYVVTMDEEDLVIKLTGNTATLDANFHNESFTKYKRKIGLYTYANENGKSIIQEPRQIIDGNIEPYSDKHLTFNLSNLEEGKNYLAYFFYYQEQSGGSWVTMSGPFMITYTPTSDSRIIPGDVNDDGKVTIADALAIVNYILGQPSGKFVFAAADMNEDKVISIADATIIVKIALGYGWYDYVIE